MSDEIMLVFGEDGVAKKYDDTWDITIHCESEEEQKAVLEKLNNSNQEPQELSKNSAELEKKNGDLQPTCNQLATDAISRQDAIDAICNACSMVEDYHKCDGYPETSTWCDELVALRALPSAHPEIQKRKEESAQNVPKEDLISRKEAIDATWEEPSYTDPINVLTEVRDRIKSLPPAQPETAKRIVGKSRNGMTLWYQCDMCNEPVDAQDDFCRGCGRRLTDG